MTDRTIAFAKSFYSWLGKFGVAVYRGVLPSGVTPDDLYIRFGGYSDNFATAFIMPIEIYKTNTTSYAEVLRIAKAIGDEVGEGGTLVIDDENGVRYAVYKGSPFYQDKADEDPTVRAGYINLEITIY